MITSPIRYFSTNEAIFGTSDLEKWIADGSIRTVDLAEAITVGQASDGGLFMPTHFPKFNSEDIRQMKNKSYPEIFVDVMKDFFQDVLPESTLDRIAKEAYPQEDPNPFRPFIEQISEIDDIRVNYIARLDEGPSAAFKDYAAQVLFRIIEELRIQKPLTIMSSGQHIGDADLMTFLTATSGDTGGAMGNAVLKRERMWMAILHSSYIGSQISDLQAKQMDTLNNNVQALWVDTDFDGCQKLVQELLKDDSLKYMNLNSANSINIGRLLPQIAYYFYIHSRVADGPNEEIAFSVPCGNFGNLVAGLFAIEMGLQMKLIVGVNQNDVYSTFYHDGLYKPAKQIHPSPSNSMNINWPSNMRRLFQLDQGRLIEGKDPYNPEYKIVERIDMPNINSMKRKIIGAYRISDIETDKIIWDFYNKKHIIQQAGEELISTLEPHGAVAWGAAQKAISSFGPSATLEWI